MREVQIGKLPARYRLVKVLGRGATATVALVEDRAEPPHRKTLKVLDGRPSADVVATLKREFRLLATLRHPALARVFEFGELADGRPYFTAELVEGKELGRATRPRHRDVCVSMAAVCRALAYLHARGTLHNDVKPANIVVPDDAPGEARLLDLGLAGVESARGTVAGTPGYLAPERLAGREADGRADLYSVGATIYRVLAGRRVVDADRPAVALRQIESGWPRLAALRPDLPPALSSLVERLLSPDPAARPRHAAEVVVALGDAIGEALPAETPGTARCYALSSFLYGRDVELERVDSLLAEGPTQAKPIVVAISGGPGMGKTRLLQEIVWRAETAGWTAASIRCDADQPADEPLGRLAAQLESDDTLPATRPSAAPALMSGGRPTLIAVDDVHRAAEAFWHGVLGALTEPLRRDPAPRVVALAYEAGALPESARRRLALVGVAATVVTIDLRPLSSAALGRMLASLFGPGAIPERARDEIALRAGGSPLLAEEIVREMVESGALTRSPRGWLLSARRRAGRATSGARIEEYLRRRSADLSEDARGTLRALCALGGDASHEALAMVSGPEVDTVLGLALLADRGLVTPSRTGALLSSEALGAVAFDGVAASRRRDYFRAAASRLEADGASDSELARAWREAGEPARAFRCARAAGLRAHASGDTALALRWLEAAESLAGRGGGAAGGVRPDPAVEILRDLGEAYDRAGRFDDAIRAFDRALGELPAGPARDRALLGALAARAAAHAGDLEGASRRLGQALAAAPEGDTLARATVERTTALLAWHRRDLPAARTQLAAVLDRLSGVAGVDADRLRARVVGLMGVMEGSFDLDAAIKRLRESVEALERSGDDGFEIAIALLNLGVDEAGAGNVTVARALLVRAVDAFDAAGSFLWLAVGLADLAWVDALAGQWDRAEDGLAKAAIAADGIPGMTAVVDAERALCAWIRDDSVACLETVRRVLLAPTGWQNLDHLCVAGAAAAAEQAATDEASRIAERAAGSSSATRTPIGAALAGAARAYAGAAAAPGASAARLRESAATLASLGSRWQTGLLLRDAARWFSRSGQPKEAAECARGAREALLALGCAAGVTRLDAVVGDAVSGAPGAGGQAWLLPLVGARSIDAIAAALPGAAAGCGVLGEVMLLSGERGAGGSVRAVGRTAAADGDLVREAARALDSGRLALVGPWAIEPLPAGERRACLAMPAATGAGPRSLLRECVGAALALAAEPPPRAVAGELSRVAERPASRLGPLDGTSLELTLGPVELRHPFPQIVGRGSAITTALTMLDRLADSEATVLLTGETGTGKEVFARALHAASRRGPGPFVVCNCAAIPDSLFEAELFGYSRGAFTGAIHDHVGFAQEASGGILFLDEVGDLPPALQPKLLRLLQEGCVRPVGGDRDMALDVRVVSATNRDLAREVAERRFRADLYYRLNVVEIKLPPLRERAADIPDLLRHLLAVLGHREQQVSPSALQMLLGYRWPGNVRELQNELQRASLLAQGGAIKPRHLTARLQRSGGRGVTLAGGSLRDQIESHEREVIKQTLRVVGGNRSEAARRLGLTRGWLRVRMAKLGVK